MLMEISLELLHSNVLPRKNRRVVLKGYLNLILQKKQISIYPANIYLFKLNHGSAIAMSEICSTKTPE